MTDHSDIVRATEIATAWLANPHTRADPDEVRSLLASVHGAVRTLTAPPPAAEPDRSDDRPKPAVGAKASLKIVGRIISMIDGRPYASLMRHLKAHGLTPDEYRRRFNLPKSYPMVAPAYSEARSAIARTLGFGRKSGEPAPAREPARAKSRGRKTASDAKKAAQAHLSGEG